VARNVDLDREFHMMICDFLGNQEIKRVMWQLRDKIHRVVANVHARCKERIEEIYPEHVAVVQALTDGDGERAAALMSEHIETSKRYLLQ